MQQIEETFLTWTVTYLEEEELPFYVRLEQLSEFYPNESKWFLDYGRFETYEQAHNYIDVLPTPEEAFKLENKIFENYL